MATVFERERNAKRDAKKTKAKADKEEKNRQIQAKVVEEFNEKQTAAAAASDPVQKLKVWCSKPPYTDLTGEVKRNTFVQVMTNISQLSKDQMENQIFTTMEVKEAAILHKYMSAAGYQIDSGDAGKYQYFPINMWNTLTNYFYFNRDERLGDSSTPRQNAHQNDRDNGKRCHSQGYPCPHASHVME